MIIDLSDNYKCDLTPWPQGTAPSGTRHVTGTSSDAQAGSTISWDLLWTGTGPPVNGPTPSYCTYA
jgi:hypothetical protein